MFHGGWRDANCVYLAANGGPEHGLGIGRKPDALGLEQSDKLLLSGFPRQISGATKSGGNPQPDSVHILAGDKVLIIVERPKAHSALLRAPAGDVNLRDTERPVIP